MYLRTPQLHSEHYISEYRYDWNGIFGMTALSPLYLELEEKWIG